MNFSFDAKSERAIKARFAKHFDSNPIRFALWAICELSIIAWAYIIFVSHNATGHLLLLVFSIVAVMLLWYYGELDELKPESLSENNEITKLMDRRILGYIKFSPTPSDLAKIVSKRPGGYFFASRFALSKEFIDLMAGGNQTIDQVWMKSIELMHVYEIEKLDSSVIVAALALSSPAAAEVLATLQLDVDDIADGLKWYQHMNQTIDNYRQKRYYGGVGRDMSFGWAPTLNRLGTNITEFIEHGGILQRKIDTYMQDIDQIIHVLSQPGRRNVTLVGPVGVGKTSLVYMLGQKLLDEKSKISKELRYNQIISLDASHLIAQAQGRGMLEELLIHLLNEAISAKNIILFLDDAQLFLKDGTGAVDLSNILLPVLEGGALKIILSLSDQEWLRLSQTNPGLAQLLNRVVVKPPDREDTIQVMQDKVLLLEGQNKVVYMHQSLEEAYKLANRFIHDQEFPGKAIKLLEAAAGFPEQKHFITSKSIQQAVEKAFDVKVQTADSFEERDVLLNLEQRIHERMINQSRAVKLVSDALRRARAGVRNENKPIGTFLFLGPTGVGKTELSKALAATYFGGEERIVRVDLNEFSHSDDTNRLLASGGNDPYSLCAQIAKQPFSVVLLDEIEKAHPNVLNLLLQLLDEGTLRDSENKPVSFRDAVIIATSNAGADKIRAHIDNGERLEQFEESFINELIDSQIFKPEFLNRFDEIILFRPLTSEELEQVVDLLMNSLNKRLAAQKVTVSLTPEAKKLMAQAGYDPRLGARPLRRVMQRAVENLVAQKVLEGKVASGQSIQLDVPELQSVLAQHDRQS